MCFNSLFCKEKEYLTLYPTVIFLFSRPPSSYLKKLWEENAFFLFSEKKREFFDSLSCTRNIFLGLFLLILPNYETKRFFYILFCYKKREYLTFYHYCTVIYYLVSCSFSFNQEGIFFKFSFLHVTMNYPFSLSLS